MGVKDRHIPDKCVEATRNVFHEGLMNDLGELGAKVAIHVIDNIFGRLQPVAHVLSNHIDLDLVGIVPRQLTSYGTDFVKLAESHSARGGQLTLLVAWRAHLRRRQGTATPPHLPPVVVISRGTQGNDHEPSIPNVPTDENEESFDRCLGQIDDMPYSQFGSSQSCRWTFRSRPYVCGSGTGEAGHGSQGGGLLTPCTVTHATQYGHP